MSEMIATIEPVGAQGMVSLRADLAAAETAAAVQVVAGCDLPGQRGVASNGNRAVAWMSPDELLILVPHAEAAAAAAELSARLAAVHHLAVDVSDARALFRIKGDGADDVVAKLCPVDTARLPAGEMRRTRAAQVAAALWRSGEAEVSLIAFRSVAGYVQRLLQVAAEGGRL